MVNMFKKGFIYSALMLLLLVSFSVESASAAEGIDYEVGVTNLNKTLENSAKIGDILKKPEIGWKRYEDSHKLIKYDGNWSKYGASAYYGGQRSISGKGTLKDKVSFTFIGSKLRIISSIYPSYSNEINIKIDGDDYTFSQSFLNENNQVICFQNTELKYGYHTVEIQKIKNGTYGTDLNIDAVDVDGFLLNPDEIPNAESITLDKNNLDLLEGSSEKLTATVAPINTNVIWTSSDESIATVDQNGNVTAIKEGLVTVTAQVENTNLYANCTVTVKKQSGTESESIKLDKNNFELFEDSKDKLTATVLPENSIHKNVVWSSSDESIAIVDPDGNVTAIREGTAIITAKIENTDIAATSTVIVKKLINESSSAILSITLVNGITKEYDVTNTVLNSYLNWFESAQGTSTFKFTKTISPYKKVTEYIVHDKIASFEVREY